MRGVVMAVLMGLCAVVGSVGIAGCSGGKGRAGKSPSLEAVRQDVAAKGKQLVELRNALLMAKERGPGGRGIKPGDAELTEQMAHIYLGPPSGAVMVAAGCAFPDGSLLVDMYARLNTLADRVAEHVRLSKIDAAAQRPVSPGSPQPFYGVVLRPGLPGERAFAELVEVGTAVCGDKTPHPEGCREPPRGFLIRTAPGAPWEIREWKDEPTLNSLLPLGDSPMVHALIAGSPATVADLTYLRRVREIEELTTQLLEMRRAVDDRLARQSR